MRKKCLIRMYKGKYEKLFPFSLYLKINKMCVD